MLRRLAVLPVAIAVAWATMLVFKRYPGISAWRRLLLPVAFILVLLTAAVPHVGQRLYDLGLSMDLINQAETAGLYVFVVAFSVTWQLLAGDHRRWFLTVLLPVAFFNWIVAALALLAWSIQGFGP